MEERVGELWDRLITRLARRDHPGAAVALASLERAAAILFRAYGGDPGLRVCAAAPTRHAGPRRLLQRIAHAGGRVEAAALDHETLYLPASVALFADPALNRELYLWLCAQGAALREQASGGAGWLAANQRATCAVLERFEGLRGRYRRLVDASIALRMPPESLPAGEAPQERAIRRALLEPGSVDELPGSLRRDARPPQPVPLWLELRGQPQPAGIRRDAESSEREAGAREAADGRRRHAERVEVPRPQSPMLMMFRAESLLSWAPYLRVNRQTDDDPEHDPGRAARELDRLSIASDSAPVASRIRFDLDLPSPADDDEPVGDGIALPEWDWKRKAMLPGRVRLQTLRTPRSRLSATPVPPHLAGAIRRMRGQMSALAQARRWRNGQRDGEEPDIDACVRWRADRLAGSSAEVGVYRARAAPQRDLACLLLADLSLSTDAWVSNEHRVIDVIRDGLLMMSEVLEATTDPYAIYGFSSLRRSHVRFHELKPFEAPPDCGTRARIAAIKPGYYTRMGAAIRRATTLLAQRPQSRRLALILSDGKPTDIDCYEGRYGVEDTRHSVAEARRQGVCTFCVTIDREGAGYLGHVFGAGGYAVISNPEQLPRRLPVLYRQLRFDAP